MKTFSDFLKENMRPLDPQIQKQNMMFQHGFNPLSNEAPPKPQEQPYQPQDQFQQQPDYPIMMANHKVLTGIENTSAGIRELEKYFPGAPKIKEMRRKFDDFVSTQKEVHNGLTTDRGELPATNLNRRAKAV